MAATSINEVRLVGRVAGATQTTLPSGDAIVSFRLVTDRAPGQRGPSGRVKVDTHDCVTYVAAVQRRILGLEDGAWLEIAGSLRRRFWRAAGGAASRTEVEVRKVTRA